MSAMVSLWGWSKGQGDGAAGATVAIRGSDAPGWCSSWESVWLQAIKSALPANPGTLVKADSLLKIALMAGKTAFGQSAVQMAPALGFLRCKPLLL